MLVPSVSLLEIGVRTILVWTALLLLLRLIGKKHISEMAPFDLVVLLLLSESVQNAISAGDNSVTSGLFAAGILIALSQIAGKLAASNKRLERILEGTPRILIRNGEVREDVLKGEEVSRSELVEALRKAGCTSIGNVRYAVLENDGSISVGLKLKLSGSGQRAPDDDRKSG